MHPVFSLRAGALSALTLTLLASAAGADPVIQLKPGLWASEGEIWINGQPLRPSVQALRAKVRSGLTDAQKAEWDRQQAAERQACLTPQQSRVDLAAYLESVMRSSGPWQCETSADTMNTSTAAGSYVCRTSGGGLTQGKFSASYGPTQYRIELNGRGNAVDGRTGQAVGGGAEMDQRAVYSGRWVGSPC